MWNSAQRPTTPCLQKLAFWWEWDPRFDHGIPGLKKQVISPVSTPECLAVKALHWLLPTSFLASWLPTSTSVKSLGQWATPSSHVTSGLCCLWAAAPGFGPPGPLPLPARDGNRGQHPSIGVTCSQAGGSGDYDLFLASTPILNLRMTPHGWVCWSTGWALPSPSLPSFKPWSPASVTDPSPTCLSLPPLNQIRTWMTHAPWTPLTSPHRPTFPPGWASCLPTTLNRPGLPATLRCPLPLQKEPSRFSLVTSRKTSRQTESTFRSPSAARQRRAATAGGSLLCLAANFPRSLSGPWVRDCFWLFPHIFLPPSDKKSLALTFVGGRTWVSGWTSPSWVCRL